MVHSLYTHSVAVPAYAYATLTTGAHAGVAVDMNKYGNNFRDALFVLVVGTVTNGTFTVTMNESDAANMAGATAVDSFRVTGTLPVFDSTTDETTYTWGVRPTLRYVQATITVDSGAAGGPVAATAVLSDGSTAPPIRS
jgi:hypothetical protein